MAAAGLSPGQALLTAARPSIATGMSLPWFGSVFNLFIAAAGTFITAVNLFAVARVRVWNPSREARPRLEDGDDFRVVNEPLGSIATARSVHAAEGEARRVWNNPILWREVCTWAHGRKIIAVRFVYTAVFLATAWGITVATHAATGATTGLPMVVLPLFVLSLVLINALAVSSITTERDLGALDLLLVTDVTPQEFIFGKLGGVFYVAKEIVLLPLLLCGYLWWVGCCRWSNWRISLVVWL